MSVAMSYIAAQSGSVNVHCSFFIVKHLDSLHTCGAVPPNRKSLLILCQQSDVERFRAENDKQKATTQQNSSTLKFMPCTAHVEWKTRIQMRKQVLTQKPFSILFYKSPKKKLVEWVPLFCHYTRNVFLFFVFGMTECLHSSSSHTCKIDICWHSVDRRSLKRRI